MISVSLLLTVVHLIGLALGVGAATVKLVLLLRCNADHGFVAAYLKVSKTISRQIILGIMLLTLSGIGFVVNGYPFTAQLIVKVVLVAVIWVMGPIIEKVVEPKFQELAPSPGEGGSPEFARILKRYLALEMTATLLFYIIILEWVLG